MALTKIHKVLLKTAAASDILAVCPNTIYAMIDRGDLEACYLFDTRRSLRISTKSIERYVKEIMASGFGPLFTPINAHFFIKPATAAWMLDIHKRSVYRLIKNGDLTAKRLPGGFRLNPATVEQFAVKKLKMGPYI